MRHHEVQQKGRDAVLLDYHLRVGQVTQDTRIPVGYRLQEQRLDETEVGDGTTVTLIDSQGQANWVQSTRAEDIAKRLGLASDAPGLVSLDVFNALMTPGDIILLMSWRNHEAAEAFEGGGAPRPDVRLRRVRVVRDYRMRDRREAPQYYPEVLPA
jgi:hypothetical protein